MKKMLIAVAVVLAAGLMTSCNKGEGCYKLSAKIEVGGLEVGAKDIYVYGEGEDIDAARQELKNAAEAMGGTAKITQTKVLGKNEEDCEAMNK